MATFFYPKFSGDEGAHPSRKSGIGWLWVRPCFESTHARQRCRPKSDSNNSKYPMPSFHKFVPLLLAFFSVPFAQGRAEQKTLTTGVSWTTSTNLTPSGTPGATDNVIIGNGSTMSITGINTGLNFEIQDLSVTLTSSRILENSSASPDRPSTQHPAECQRRLQHRFFRQPESQQRRRSHVGRHLIPEPGFFPHLPGTEFRRRVLAERSLVDDHRRGRCHQSGIHDIRYRLQWVCLRNILQPCRPEWRSFPPLRRQRSGALRRRIDGPWRTAPPEPNQTPLRISPISPMGSPYS